MESRPAPDPYYVLRGSAVAVTTTKFAPLEVAPEGLVASGSSKGIVSLWDLKTRRARQTLDGHDGQGILGLDFLSNGTVISQGKDGFVRVWAHTLSSYQLAASIETPAIGFCKVSTLKKGCQELWPIRLNKDFILFIPIVEWSQSNMPLMCILVKVNIVDIASQQIVHRVIPKAGKSLGMCMCAKLFISSLDQKPLILVGYESGGVVLWDVKASRMVSHDVLHREPVMCLDVDEENLRFITGSADNKLCVMSINPEYRVVRDREIELKAAGVASIKVRSDNKLVAAGCWDGRIRVYSWKKLRPLAYLSYHTDTVNALDFSEARLPLGSHTGSLMAAGSKDSRISLWDLYNE